MSENKNNASLLETYNSKKAEIINLAYTFRGAGTVERTSLPPLESAIAAARVGKERARGARPGDHPGLLPLIQWRPTDGGESFRPRGPYKSRALGDQRTELI